jgi:hypothetical protein
MGLLVVGDTSFTFTYISSTNQDSTASLRGACNQGFDKGSMSWGINNGT